MLLRLCFCPLQLRKLQSQMDVRSSSHSDLLSSLTARDGEIQELRKQVLILERLPFICVPWRCDAPCLSIAV